MSKIEEPLVSGVKSFLDHGDRGFLELLMAESRESLPAQSVVRYLLQIKHWPMTPDSRFSEVLTHLFGAYPNKAAVDPDTYKVETARLILEAFAYECVVVVPEPRPEPKANPGKVTRRPKMIKEQDSEGGAEDEGESGSRTFKSINESLDTTGASDRLKRTIAIQRQEA